MPFRPPQYECGKRFLETVLKRSSVGATPGLISSKMVQSTLIFVTQSVMAQNALIANYVRYLQGAEHRNPIIFRCSTLNAVENSNATNIPRLCRFQNRTNQPWGRP